VRHPSPNSAGQGSGWFGVFKNLEKTTWTVKLRMEKYFEQDLAACAWTPNRDGYAAKLLVFVTITKSHWSQRIIV